MNIYFACSITGGREFESAYQAIVAALEADGHVIPTSHLVQSEVVVVEKIISPLEVYTRDINWINQADCLIAEVSTPSHGVGYEIAHALGLGKPVLCIHAAGRSVSKMLTGNNLPNIQVKQYSEIEKAIEIARKFLGEI